MELPRFAGLDNWQWLYIIEALPAILLGFLTLRVLTDRPEQATWLNQEERSWLAQTLAAEQIQGKSRKGANRRFWAVLRDPRVLALALVYSGTTAGLYALGFWSPLFWNNLAIRR